MSTELIFTIRKEWWLTSNQRLHWAAKAKKVSAALRQLAAIVARKHQAPKRQTVYIAAYIQYPTAAKADPHNAMPTLKALIDGLVDYGLIPDDSHEHLIGPDVRREKGKSERGTHRVRLVITGQDVNF